MSFLNPWMLLALAATAIPLLIHLLHLRRPKRIAFSSLRFLRALEASAIRRFRVQQWWLLLVRTLAVAALVLAFAQPVLRGPLAQWAGASERVSVALVVDNSLSMTLADERGTYWRQAQEAARALLQTLRGGDWIYVIPTAGSWPEKPEALTSPEAARQRLERLGPEAASHSLAEAIKAAAEALQESPSGAREIVILSDFQRTAFGSDTLPRLPGSGLLRALTIGPRPPHNVGIVSAELPSVLLAAGQPARIRAVVANYSRAPVEGALLSVHIEGQRLGQSTFSLPPEGRTEVEVLFTPPRAGWLSGVLALEEDPFPYDNQLLFSLHVPDRFRVLLVKGPGADAGWLELALSPEVLGSGQIVWSSASPDGLEDMDLSGFEAIWLVGLEALSPTAQERLVRFVERGGGMCLFPAERSAEPYGRLVAALGGGSWGPMRRFERPVGLGAIELDHPLLNGLFLRTAEQATRPESPEVFRLLPYQVGPSGRDQVIMSLATGEAFLSELRSSGGPVLLFGLSPDPAWSDWPFRGLFAPLLYRALLYTATPDWNRPMAFWVGQSAWIRLPGPLAGPVRLIGPDGIPQPLEPTFLAHQIGISYTAQEAGLYEIRSEETFLRYAAFNLSPLEGDVRRIPLGELERRLRAFGWTVQLHPLEQPPTPERVRAWRYGAEAWAYFLLVAILLLVVEGWLSRRPLIATDAVPASHAA
ncbi:MAG: BatA domain-containing protein [Bacteroidota bacterium]|nr:BatA domain-containing protein [Rhodothermia bacterium]MCS7154589.1 BatA domain-containing protein [Bacteroidota bacterium]MDW8137382.1 BatA domain-containing protein [Bacteroidota bacterium]MDW8285664.1 BatA domain-containing protein [Bacteroidota bacterium]